MASSAILDKYDQFAVLSVPATVAASGTVSAQLVTGLSNMQKVAWAVTRIEYWFTGLNWTTKLTTHGNSMRAGWQQSYQTGGAANAELYTYVLDDYQITKTQTPAAVGEALMDFPKIHDFSLNPRLFLPQNLWVYFSWAFAANAAATDGVHTRIWYKEIELGAADWYDLLQLRLPLGAI